MARTSTLPLVDRVLNGQLRETLATHRAAGETYEQIARWLAAEHGIDVVSTTISRWCTELGVEAPSERAS